MHSEHCSRNPIVDPKRAMLVHASVDLLSNEANDTQHDAVLDYYGRRLATCSSDKTIKIFEVEGEKHTLVETLRGYVANKQYAVV